jgi:hypothetical protein
MTTKKDAPTADEPVARNGKALTNFQDTMRSLQSRRAEKLKEVDIIDQGLRNIRSTINDLLGVKVAPVVAPRRGRPVRSGKSTGTSIVEGILRDHKGKMLSADCARLAEKRGVNNPHSAFQSLKKRERIELKDGYIEFTDAK